MQNLSGRETDKVETKWKEPIIRNTDDDINNSDRNGEGKGVDGMPPKMLLTSLIELSLSPCLFLAKLHYKIS